MWEVVYAEPYDIMERLPTQGGWLYRNRYVTSGSAQDPQHYVWMVTMAFVPADAPLAPPGRRERHHEAAA
jgi:hypothetical protein